jgi:hypothetical protein
MATGTQVPWADPGGAPCCCEPDITCTRPISEDQEQNALTVTAGEFAAYYAGGSVTFTFAFNYYEEIKVSSYGVPLRNANIMLATAGRTSTRTLRNNGTCSWEQNSAGSRVSIQLSEYLIPSGCTFGTPVRETTRTATSDSFCWVYLYLNNEGGIYRVLPVITGAFTYDSAFLFTRPTMQMSTEQNINFAPTVWQSQAVTFQGQSLTSGSQWFPGSYSCFYGEMNASIAVTYTPSAP